MRMAVGRVGVILAASVVILKFCQVACTAVANTPCSNNACTIANALCGNNNNCACNPGYIDKPEGTCTKVLGSPCTDNTLCSAVNFTACNTTCQCVTGYNETSALCTKVSSTSGTQPIAGTQSCNNDADCNQIPNSACTAEGQNMKCTCKSGFTMQGNACHAVSSITAGTQSCSSDAECNKLPNSACTGEREKKCTCKSGYTMQGNACHAAPDGGCKADTDCVEDATCSKSTNKCQCKEKYEAKEGLCVESGARSWVVSIWLVSLLVIGGLQ